MSDGISSNLRPLGKKKSTKIGKPGDGAERGAWGKALAAPRACHMMKPALVPIQSRKHERTKTRSKTNLLSLMILFVFSHFRAFVINSVFPYA